MALTQGVKIQSLYLIIKSTVVNETLPQGKTNEAITRARRLVGDVVPLFTSQSLESKNGESFEIFLCIEHDVFPLVGYVFLCTHLFYSM